MLPARKLILMVLLLAAAACAFFWTRDRGEPKALSREELIERGLVLLEEQEAAARRRYWAPEIEAQRLGAVVDQFWNGLKRSGNKIAKAREAEVAVIAPVFSEPRRLGHGIEIFRSGGKSRPLAPAEWSGWLARQEAAGWQAGDLEFRHTRFQPGAAGQALSFFYFAVHLVNEREGRRAILEGDLVLHWDASGAVREVGASGLELRSRTGKPPFRRVLYEELQPPEGSFFIDPVIVRPDGEGVEIILASLNRVYARSTDGEWSSRDLCQNPPRLVMTAMIHDFDGDGREDFLCASFDGLTLRPGTETGFGAPRMAWRAKPRLEYAQALTTGDVDTDGDSDLFLAQYKPPYAQGQMPAPYFDANDGHPAFLLLNDGRGNFRDATGESGLAAKRFRRSYSASFVDLDGDRDLDLVVVNDFAGVDTWENTGGGKFQPADWFAEPFGLGMAHVLADFNRDGWLDFLMIGMNSPTADRLDHLGLQRPYYQPDKGMRKKITFGNRLWMGEGSGRYEPAPFDPDLARTGWSWGAAAGDINNDGHLDLYIANGHETRERVEEYDPEFWLHDIYVGNSRENALVEAWFKRKFGRTRAKGMSYGGHERNRLLLNLAGNDFVEIGHLFGVSLAQDSRNALWEDVNGDGRLDLIVTTFEAWPAVKQTLQVFENHLEETGNWISVSTDGLPPGTRIEGEGLGAAQVVTGEGYRSQGSGRMHFGLGEGSGPEMIRALLPGGGTLQLTNPRVNAVNAFLPGSN